MRNIDGEFRYLVSLLKTTVAEVEIYARSEDEAKQKALRLDIPIEAGTYSEYDWEVIEVI